MNYEEIKDKLFQGVSRKLESVRDINDETLKITAGEVLNNILDGEYLSVSQRSELIYFVLNNMKKLGPLQPLLEDKSISEIMINGPFDVFIEKNGKVTKWDKKFESRKQLEDIIQRIVSKVNRTVDTANPICDARLDDGSRVNIVLNPIAIEGPIVTIRKFPESVMQFDDLVQMGAINKQAAQFLQEAVKAKYNIFVSGGTGSGKTTFLNALSNFIPSDERIITIEDSVELQIKTIPNIVRLETRNANTEGKGEISIRDLIKSSLRMRPERIVVGEVRGPEALDMLQAMNTGHDGSLSTGHANSPKDMLARLETMVLTGADFPIEAIRQQIACAIDIIVHLGRLSDKSRRTLEIIELCGYENGKYIINPIFSFEKTDIDSDGKIIGKLKRSENKFYNMHKFNMAGIKTSIND